MRQKVFLRIKTGTFFFSKTSEKCFFRRNEMKWKDLTLRPKSLVFFCQTRILTRNSVPVKRIGSGNKDEEKSWLWFRKLFSTWNKSHRRPSSSSSSSSFRRLEFFPTTSSNPGSTLNHQQGQGLDLIPDFNRVPLQRAPTPPPPAYSPPREGPGPPSQHLGGIGGVPGARSESRFARISN